MAKLHPHLMPGFSKMETREYVPASDWLLGRHSLWSEVNTCRTDPGQWSAGSVCLENHLLLLIKADRVSSRVNWVEKIITTAIWAQVKGEIRLQLMFPVALAHLGNAGEFQPTLTPYVNGCLYSSKHQTIPLEMPQERAKSSFKVEAFWLIPQWIQSNGAKQAWVTEQTISFRSWMCTVLCVREAVRWAVSLKTPATCTELTVHGSYKAFFSYM